MARPLRVNYENAVYHVMNRGRGRNAIFHGKKYIDAFLLCLEEAHQLFGLEILAYCLMGNHYHLLLRTPKGNLSRCMRHINGLYTQRYNKLKKTDGPLFRGRFKAILVEANSYLLQVSRYIHRNPIETKIPLVENLIDYSQSSYPAYLNHANCPVWLNTSVILSALDQQKNIEIYQAFVEDANQDELTKFYESENQLSILGSKEFMGEIEKYVERNAQEIPRKQLPTALTINIVTEKVAIFYKMPIEQILAHKKGKGKKNLPRKIALYLCRKKTEATLQEIAEHFNLTHYSSVSNAVTNLQIELQENHELKTIIELLFKDLTP